MARDETTGKPPFIFYFERFVFWNFLILPIFFFHFEKLNVYSSRPFAIRSFSTRLIKRKKKKNFDSYLYFCFFYRIDQILNILLLESLLFRFAWPRNVLILQRCFFSGWWDCSRNYIILRSLWRYVIGPETVYFIWSNFWNFVFFKSYDRRMKTAQCPKVLQTIWNFHASLKWVGIGTGLDKFWAIYRTLKFRNRSIFAVIVL